MALFILNRSGGGHVKSQIEIIKRSVEIFSLKKKFRFHHETGTLYCYFMKG